MIRISVSRSGLWVLALAAIAVIAFSAQGLQSTAGQDRAILLSSMADYHQAVAVPIMPEVERATLGLRPTFPIDDHVFRKVNREALRNSDSWSVEKRFGAWRHLSA